MELADKEKKILILMIESEIRENKGKISDSYLCRKNKEYAHLIEALSDRNKLLNKILDKLKIE